MSSDVSGAFLPTKEEVGSALSQIAKRKGLSVKEIGKRIGTHQNNLYKNFNGHTWLEFERFFKVCHGMGIDPEDVLKAIRQVQLGMSVALPTENRDRAAEAFEDAKRRLLETRSYLRKDGDRKRGDS